MAGRWRGSRSWIVLGVVLLLFGAASGGLALWNRSVRAELVLARAALTAGHYGLAQERLSRLAKRWTNRGEVFLLLGESQLAQMRREDAIAAWAKVERSSPHFSRAALLMATHLTNSGRYTPAETALVQALAKPDESVHFELERSLARVYRYEGRFDDVRRVARASWCRSPDPAGVLKELWAHDRSPMPVESWKKALDSADDNDDRVWLGRANQAILTGRFAESADWLERCLKRRPDDPVVWRSRLELAMAIGDVPAFWAAARRLPASGFDAGQQHKIRAWLAARSGAAELEERELSTLLADNPGNTQALERLAVLALRGGRSAEANQLHRKKAELDRAFDACRKTLLDEATMSAHAGELAQFMTVLGREFEARGWSIVAEAASRGKGTTAAPSPEESDRQSPLPADLAAQAIALSASYPDLLDDRSSTGPALALRLADLQQAASLQEKIASSAPTTPGGNLPGPIPQFVDDAEAAGLRFVFDNGRSVQHQLPETMSGGVGLLDFDDDGWLDVYCVQGGRLDDQTGTDTDGTPAGGDRLYRNRGDGTFDDATDQSAIAKIAWGRGYGLGVTVGDYDNDGHSDLFVTRLRTYSLYRNRGDGTFEDVTLRAGLAGVRDNPTSAAFADLDNDGDLDLYVCHYMIWDPAHPRLCRTETGEFFYCDPSKVEAAPDHVFRNDAGRFVDVTAASGCAETRGRGLGVIAADLDLDNRIDLYVANDGTANYLYHNLGNFRFEEVALEAGAAGNAEGGYQAGMGVACGDLDGDGLPELMVTNFYGEGTTLYQNLGQGLFTDRSAASGIGLASRYLLGFGIAMADVTNNGRLDVMITNGHVNDNGPYYHYAMPARLYENRPDGRLVDVSSQAGAPWQVERVGRGLAAGDLDNDGRVDALILAQNQPLAYFHNQTPRPGNFVIFRLAGSQSNRDGVGARLIVTAGGQRQVRERTGGGSYQSANDPRLNFGLGTHDRVDSVEIRWPSGKSDRWTDLPAGTGYLLREGDPRPGALAGFAKPLAKPNAPEGPTR
jgi:enediyne biosynthesis protein E4